MKKIIAEQTLIFISVLKWVFISTVIGALVGLSVTLFLKLLNYSIETGSSFPYPLLLIPPAFFLSSLLTKYLAPEAEGHGTEKVIEAIHKKSGKINAIVIPVKAAATLLTLSAGGSAGKEGPCAQIGAGVASTLSDIFNLAPKDRKKIVICGISAGFASVFGTPIAGAIFGVEVLAIGSLLYDVLLPSFIAGITAYEVSSNLGINYFHNPIILSPTINEAFFLKILLGGVFFGICSVIFIESLNLTEKISSKIKIWKPLKALIGGIVLSGLAMIFSTKFLGLGLDSIEHSLKGGQMIWYAFLIKILFTSITLSFGGSGGIITPIFFVGTAAGSLYAALTGLDPSTVSSIGFAALLAGCANTPISASIMSVELFGPSLAPYATVACVISFLITGHRSVYPSQILSFRKTGSMNIELGKEIENTEFNPSHPGFRLFRLKMAIISKTLFSKMGFYSVKKKKKGKNTV